jgi:hypothetical protein
LASEGVKGGSAEDRKVHSCFVWKWGGAAGFSRFVGA